MSHEITEIDQQEGTSMGWHNLTKVKAVILLATCWLAQWDVRKRPLFRKLADGTEQTTDACEVVCTDDEKIIIGKPLDATSYTLLTNKGFLAIVQSCLDKIRGACVASVGSVCRRGRIFVSLQIPQMESFIAGGREFRPYLNFLSSHDKSCPFVLNLGTVCVVCNNTFNMNLSDRDENTLRIRIKHTAGMAAQLEDVPSIVDAYFASVQKFSEVMNHLAAIPVTEEAAKEFFAGLLTDKMDKAEKTKGELAELSTRRTNQINRLAELFKTGKGNKGENLSDVFQAVTDYYSHENSGNVSSEDSADKFKQVASSEFGTGQTMKAFAFAVLQDDKRIAKLMAKGKKVLAGVEE